MLGKRLGRKAMLWGAVAQSLPDVDFIASLWMSPADNLLAHRGLTHSIFFAPVFVALCSFIAKKIHTQNDVTLGKWMLFFLLEVLVHLFLDGFNAYGVGWLEPFSSQRFSFNTIFVADPLFSIGPLLVFIILLVKTKQPRKVKWEWLGLGTATLYLAFCTVNKIKIDREVKNALAKQSVRYTDYLTTPVAFNSLLWYVVAKNKDGVYTGYRSVLDKNDTIALHYFPRHEEMLHGISNEDELKKLKRFAGDFYTVEKWGDTVVFNVLRFGQVTGWEKPDEHFVFHYFLDKPGSNKLVMQRGRFEKWDWNAVRLLIKRIKGI